MSRSLRQKVEILDHVHALRLGTTVVMAWDAAGEAPVRVRVLRSPADSASGADDFELLRFEQTLVYEGETAELIDAETISSAPKYYYTVFALDAESVWQEQMAAVLQPASEVHWARDPEGAEGSAAARFAELRRQLPG